MEQKKEIIQYTAYTKKKKYELDNSNAFVLQKLHLHRNDGPALIRIYKNKKNTQINEIYYQNNLIHRTDGPAIIRKEDGIILYEAYYINGLIHRENGPAMVWYNLKQIPYIIKYYLKNTQYKKSEFEKKLLQNKISIL